MAKGSKIEQLQNWFTEAMKDPISFHFPAPFFAAPPPPIRAASFTATSDHHNPCEVTLP